MSEREDKHPWSKWFWQDFEADMNLRLCSLGAQGLWMRMLSIMAKSNKKGFLLENDKQMESKSLAKLVGISVEEINELLAELEYRGVFSRDSQGVIYNRRMVREAELSQKRAEAGSKGGKSKKQNESKDESKTQAHSEYASASASASEYASVKDKEETKNNIGQFEVFWKQYPRKVRKEDTFTKWKQLKKSQRDEVLKTLKNFNDAMSERERSKIMHPTTFLNPPKKRWQDFLPENYDPSNFKKSKQNKPGKVR